MTGLAAPRALHGALTALVTPFREDGEVDLATFKALVRWQVESGIDGLVPCGTTGEGATLLSEEQDSLVAAAVDAAEGRVPVVAGCGTNDTRRTLELARRAAAAGADALNVTRVAPSVTSLVTPSWRRGSSSTRTAPTAGRKVTSVSR